MNRNRAIIGFVAVLAIVVGGVFAANNVYACDGCSAHAKKADATEAKAVDTKAVKAGGSCCPSGAKNAAVKTASAKGQCSESAKTASAKGQCSESAKTASAKGQCSIDGKKTAELMNGEATLAKLSHCGINVNAASTEKLAAKLADGGCGKYSAEQWATMIDAAKGLDAKATQTVMASVKTQETCESDKCPISLVAKDLASVDTKKN